jgi:hypothetical protein
MPIETQTASRPDQDLLAREQIEQLRELFADAPEMGKTTPKRLFSELNARATETPQQLAQSPGQSWGHSDPPECPGSRCW